MVLSMQELHLRLAYGSNPAGQSVLGHIWSNGSNSGTSGVVPDAHTKQSAFRRQALGLSTVQAAMGGVSADQHTKQYQPFPITISFSRDIVSQAHAAMHTNFDNETMALTCIVTCLPPPPLLPPKHTLHCITLPHCCMH